MSILLSGCAVLSPAPLPTPFPKDYIPTVIAMTVQAGSTQQKAMQATMTASAPSATPSPLPLVNPSNAPEILFSSPTPTPTFLPPTATPIPTDENGSLIGLFSPTQEASDIPYARIQIQKPGAFSKLTTPIQLRIFIYSTQNQRVQVELLGEDGRLLARNVLYTPDNKQTQTYLNTEIPFEISAVAELALLRISLFDNYARLLSINSEPIFLLSLGTAETAFGVDTREPIVMEQPTEGALIQGGSLTISGKARIRSELPLIISLVTRDGKKIVVDEAILTPISNSDYGAFSVEVPYQVDAPTWVRVTIEEQSQRPPGALYLTSREVFLSP